MAPWVIAPVVLVLALAAILLAVSRARHSGDDSALAAKQAGLNALKDQLIRQRLGPPADSQSAPPDELTAEAQRTIKRLRDQNGISGPPADSEGKVHLQTGGTISRDEWERAARSLRN